MQAYRAMESGPIQNYRKAADPMLPMAGNLVLAEGDKAMVSCR